MTGTQDRKEELKANLEDIEARITAACTVANRPRNDVHLIVVTKTWPASDMQLLNDLGVTQVGENRDQEASGKNAELQDCSFVWHAIGQLQTNKVKSVAQWADVVHSVDRPSLIDALDKVTAGRTTPLAVLIQVNLDGLTEQELESGNRGGCHPNHVAKLALQIESAPGLVLNGVMGVAPLGEVPDPAFALLKKTSEQLVMHYPEATWISAGMSDDLESAVNNGATHLRIGSAVLGHRITNR